MKAFDACPSGVPSSAFRITLLVERAPHRVRKAGPVIQLRKPVKLFSRRMGSVMGKHLVLQ